MVKFVHLTEDKRRLFFSKLKENIDFSWEKFYPAWKISRSTFFSYLSGKYDIPLPLFIIWQRITKTSINPIIIEKEKFLKKDFVDPKIDKSLAEIIGVLNGDGHVSNFKYEVCVAGNSLEEDYFDYLKKLFESKLNLTFKIIHVPSGLKMRCYSKGLSNFLLKLGLPKGNKMNHLRIIPVIKNSKSLLINYLRGLFDTDGTIYTRRKKDVVLEVSSGDKKFLEDIHHAFISLGLNARIYEKHISLYNFKDIHRFFSIIKPANTKHLKKYKEYLKLSAGGPENISKS